MSSPQGPSARVLSPQGRGKSLGSGRTPPASPAFVSAALLRLPFLFPTRKAFIRSPGANRLPPAREPVPERGEAPARRPSQPIPARERLGAPVGGGARRVSPGARGRPRPPQTSPPPRAGAGRVVRRGSRWEAGPAPSADGRERPRDWRAAGARQVLLLRREGAGGAAAAGRRDARRGACAPGARRPARRYRRELGPPRRTVSG